MNSLLGKPGDRRNFVHKRIFGAIKGFVSGGPLGAVGGFVGGGGVPATAELLVPAGCPPGFWRHPNGECLPLKGRELPGPVAGLQRFIPGGATGMTEFGDAVLGQYGAALEPGIRSMDTRVCPRGTVLGLDGLCYNRRDLRNSERMWPRGRRPLLTGGDMRCISIAAAAAKKLQKKQKQLQAMGMLKKPSPRRARALAPGHHQHVEHD